MKKLLILLLTVTMIMTCSVCAVSVSAKTIYTKTISLLEIRANAKGDGYKWDNYNDTLTLDGLNIKTEDAYGLKIIDGATVILKGENRIKASEAAIFIQGKVIFKGDGKLILEGKTGIYCSSNDQTDTLTINGGVYEINATDNGMISAFHKISLTNCKVNINAGLTAIEAQRLNVGAKTVITANAGLIGNTSLHIEGANLSVSASDKALFSNSEITFSKLQLKTGSSSDSLRDAEKYNGESFVKTVSTYDDSKRSVVFGDKYPAAADYLLVFAVAICLGAVIGIPVAIHKKKAKDAITARDIAEEERRAEEKARKKASKKEKQS